MTYLNLTMIGQAIIELGATSAKVANINIATSSKIFITWNDNLEEAQAWICWKEAGKWFDVCLNKLLDKPVKFDYWTVDVSGQDALNPLSIDSTSPVIENPATEPLAPDNNEESAITTEPVSEVPVVSEPEVEPSASEEPTLPENEENILEEVPGESATENNENNSESASENITQNMSEDIPSGESL